MNFSEFAQRECPELVPPVNLPHGITLVDLEAELGTDPDWPKIKGDGRLLRGYAEIIVTTRQVRSGQVPDGWTETFQCEQCGPVLLEPGGPKELAGCPWCLNRGQDF